VGTVGVVGFQGALSFMATTPFHTMANYSFIVLPMFLLMGSFAGMSGLVGELFSGANKWVGRLPGGMAMAVSISNGIFGAICGSTTAATSLFTKTVMPEMKRFKYDNRLSASCIAASGSLSALIPPSAAMVFYSIFTEASLGRLMLAGFIPGGLEVISYMFIIYIWVRLRPNLAPGVPEPSTWKEKLLVTKVLIPIGAIVLIVFGGIYLGVFTPTEAGAIGAFSTLLLAMWRRGITWGRLGNAMIESISTMAMVSFVLLGGIMFGRMLAVSGVAPWFTEFLSGLGVRPVLIMAMIVILYLIMGMFMTLVSAFAMTLPLFLPVMMTADVDLIWAGILCIKMLEMGVITPPVGLNVYVIKALSGDDTLKVQDIFKGVLPFLTMDLVSVILILAFPQIALWLPSTMKGG
jgi:C4-dicarboxylate transporter DctM subunit